MRTVEQRAQDFTSSGDYSPTLKESYIAGAAEEHLLLTHWQHIETDKDGFATEEALDELWNNRPVLVKDIQDNYYFIIQNESDFADWGAELYHKPQYFKWRKIYE